jgi:hypothetical protein
LDDTSALAATNGRIAAGKEERKLNVDDGRTMAERALSWAAAVSAVNPRQKTIEARNGGRYQAPGLKKKNEVVARRDSDQQLQHGYVKCQQREGRGSPGRSRATAGRRA